MNRLPWIGLAVILGAAMTGCGQSGNSAAPATTSQENSTATASTGRPQGSGPGAAVFDFLEAVRTGSDQKASNMLTPLARKKVAEQHLVVAPPGSDTAKFELGSVQLLGDDGARVVIKWTDVDENNKPRTDQVTWMVRKVEEGWRIAGVAAPVFEGEPPVLLNFEDPEEMLRQQQLVREEVRRRMEKEQQQAQPAPTPEKEKGATQAQRPAKPEQPAVR
jgi:hypothetical protein